MAFGKKRLPTPKEEKLPFFKFLAWKSSDVASAVAYLIVSTYLMRFCTDFLGLDSLTVGNILLISNIVDFITDFIGAVIVDNTNTQIGRGRPYELSIVGVTICTILLFATPTSWSDTVKYLWVFFVYTFEFGVFNTMRGAGQNAYTIRAWKNRKVIGKLSSYGGFVTTIGSMCVSLSFPVLMGTIATTAEGWLRLVAIYMVPLTLIGTLRFIFVKEDTSVDAHNHEKVDFKAIFRMLKKNKYGWYYAGIMLLFNTIQSLGTLSYYWKYIVGDESLSGMFSIFSIILMPVMLFFPLMMKKWSPAQMIAGAAGFSAIGYLVSFIAKDNIPMLLAGGVLSALAMLPISYLGYMIIMDLASYNRHVGLPSMEASIGSIFNGFGTQLGQGIGGWITGAVLSISGYVSATGGEAVQQPESALFAIRFLHTLLPMVLMILIGVCGFGLAKLAKKIPQIEADLAEQDAAK